MKNIFIVLALAFTFYSCDKAFVLDLKDSKTKVVIEGLLTDQPDHQYIKVTKSADFYYNHETPRVTTAIVSVKDDQGNTYAFEHNPDSAGYYFPQTPFVGVIGRTYTLSVEVDGVLYTGEDKLFSVTPITKLESKVDEDEKKDPEIEGRFYETLVFAVEPQETKDYYLFKFYRNDSLKFDSPEDIYFSDDDLLGENIDGVSSPIYYAVGDKAKVEAYSLTKSGFIFYSDLQKLLNNDGGLFGSPPANCRTNLTNGALGFFQVSALNQRETIVNDSGNKEQ
jgi:hypothetical protein